MSQSLSKQSILEGTKVSIKEKLQKRIIRSKITKIISHQFSDPCNKLQYKMIRVNNLENKRRQINQQIHDEIRQDPQFIQRRLVFTPYEEQEFVPSAKISQFNIKPPLPSIIKPKSLFDVQRTILSQLTPDELLEVGEDPAYYIQNVELRNLPWIQEGWLENNEKSKFSFTGSTKRPQTISSDSRLLKPRLTTKEEESNQDYIKKKNEILLQSKERIKQQNQFRFEQFQQNFRKIQQEETLQKQKIQRRILQKQSQSDKKLQLFY